MSFNVDRCVPEDARELSEALLETYKPGARFQATYHRVPEETLLKVFEEDFRKEIELQDQPNATPEVHYLKVNDPSTNEIIAFAVWKYLPQGYRVEQDSQIEGQGLPEGINETLHRHMCRMTGKLRSEHPGRHEAHWCKSRTA